MQHTSSDPLPVIQFVDESVVHNGNGNYGAIDLKMEGGIKRTGSDAGFDDSDSESEDAGSGGHVQMQPGAMGGPGIIPKAGKKTKGRVKIKMEFIENKLRRYTTFSKRKTGIMKKAYELSTLTGTQVMLLVASETGHVYTFATRKLQPMITSESGKALIQTCLNSPDPPPSTPGQQHAVEQRMNPTGFEETELSYAVAEDEAQKSESPSPMHMSQTSKPTATVYATPTSQMPQALNLQVHSSTPSPAPSPSMSPISVSQQSYTPQQTIAVGANYFTTPTSTGSGKQQAVSMQVPAAGITGGITAIIPPAGLPPGTPITIGPIQGQQTLNVGGQGQQAMFHIPTSASGQIISLPGYTNFNQGSSGSNSKPNEQTSNQSQQPSVTMMSALIPNGATTSSPAGTVMYQTPQGVVYAAAPTTTGLSALPEGYVLNLPQTPIQIQPDGQTTGGQQYITIPVPVTLSGGQSAMLQPILAQQSVATTNPSDHQRASSQKPRK